MHEQCVELVLSNGMSIILAGLAFLLAVLYLIDLLLINSGVKRPMRKEGIAIRLINWLAFGFIFLLFGQIVPLKDIYTWRAAARLALAFLMLSEALFEIITLIPAIKGTLWKKET
jgi:hypothetical protein